MKIKVGKLYDAVLIISAIIRDRRPMPQKGKYRLARLHAKLHPEFATIDAQRDEMIKSYNTHVKVAKKDDATGETSMVDGDAFCVPEDKAAEFNEAWKKITDEEIEVDVEPIPLAYLDLGDKADGSVNADELVTLGELVTE